MIHNYLELNNGHKTTGQSAALNGHHFIPSLLYREKNPEEPVSTMRSNHHNIRSPERIHVTESKKHFSALYKAKEGTLMCCEPSDCMKKASDNSRAVVSRALFQNRSIMKHSFALAYFSVELNGNLYLSV